VGGPAGRRPPRGIRKKEEKKGKKTEKKRKKGDFFCFWA
jgi:hypothetical protein